MTTVTAEQTARLCELSKLAAARQPTRAECLELAQLYADMGRQALADEWCLTWAPIARIEEQLKALADNGEALRALGLHVPTVRRSLLESRAVLLAAYEAQRVEADLANDAF